MDTNTFQCRHSKKITSSLPPPATTAFFFGGRKIPKNWRRNTSIQLDLSQKYLFRCRSWLLRIFQFFHCFPILVGSKSGPQSTNRPVTREVANSGDGFHTVDPPASRGVHLSPPQAPHISISSVEQHSRNAPFHIHSDDANDQKQIRLQSWQRDWIKTIAVDAWTVAACGCSPVQFQCLYGEMENMEQCLRNGECEQMWKRHSHPWSHWPITQGWCELQPVVKKCSPGPTQTLRHKDFGEEVWVQKKPRNKRKRLL